MPNLYATPTNTREKLGYTLIQILNLPNSSLDPVVNAANELLEGSAISTPVSVSEEAAARQLYRAILTANGQADTGLRGRYTLPLKTATGDTDPNNPEFYPDIIGHVISIVKWELLAARPDIRNEQDREEYTDALRYLGLPLDGGGVAASASLVGMDITGTGAGSPRGAVIVQVGDPDKTRERRARMGNADWQDRF